MKRLLLSLFALTCVFAVTGCGQSGPLYLPGNPSKIQAPAEQPEEPQQDEEQSEESGDK